MLTLLLKVLNICPNNIVHALNKYHVVNKFNVGLQFNS